MKRPAYVLGEFCFCKQAVPPEPNLQSLVSANICLSENNPNTSNSPLWSSKRTESCTASRREDALKDQQVLSMVRHNEESKMPRRVRQKVQRLFGALNFRLENNEYRRMKKKQR